MKKSELKRIINEELGRYMFFENLRIIKNAADEMLKLDDKMVDGILASGHDWAADHIATSKDDVEEVYNFLMNKKVAGPVGMDEKKLSPKQMKIAKAAPPEDKITGADFAALRKGLNEASKLKIAGHSEYDNPTEIYTNKGDVLIKRYHSGGFYITTIKKNDIPTLINFLQSAR